MLIVFVVCKRCRLREGGVVEFTEGFTFLGRDGELHVLVEGKVYAVNAETPERTEVDRDNGRRPA